MAMQGLIFRFSAVFAAWLVIGSAPAGAGAWPRGEGNVFLAFSVRSNDGIPFSGAYLEAGISDRLTFQLDMSEGTERNAMTSVTAHLAGADATVQYAAGFGLGVRADEPSFRGTLNLGRGWSAGDHSGWATADLSREWASIGAYSKVDITVGLNGKDGWSRFGQLFLYWEPDGRAFHSVELHQAIPLGERLVLDLGLSRGLGADGSTGGMIGFWASF